MGETVTDTAAAITGDGGRPAGDEIRTTSGENRHK
jgi:hypothetical protein